MLFTGESKLLEEWLDQLMDAADPGDFSMLIMKFNRKGKYVAVEHCDSFEQNFKNYFVYTSQKHGKWLINDYEEFWENNSQIVKLKSSNINNNGSSADVPVDAG